MVILKLKQLSTSSVARRSISWVFYLFLAYFIFNYIREIDFSQLSTLEVNLPLLFLASIVSLSFRYWGAVIWLVLLLDLGAKITSYPILFYVYAKSWLGRYLPGKVTWILGRIYFASEQGVSKSSLAMSATIESGMQVAMTLGLSLLLLSLDSRFEIISDQARLLMLIASLFILIVLTPKPFNWLFRFTYTKAKKQPFNLKITTTTIVKGVSLNIISFFLSGIAYFLFSLAIYPELGLDSLLFVVSTFNLAGAIGILAFFAPSGLGVREGIQLLLLSTIMPADIALVISVASRIWSIAIDALFYGCTYAFKTIRSSASNGKASLNP